MTEIWSRADIHEGVDYRLELCQDAAQRRFFRLLPHDAFRSFDVESVAVTQKIAQRDLLLRGDLLGLCEQTFLDTGERYFVDAHGVWFLLLEWEALSSLAAGHATASTIPWATSKPPILPNR